MEIYVRRAYRAYELCELIATADGCARARVRDSLGMTCAHVQCDSAC
jgi:hypothetical protein